MENFSGLTKKITDVYFSNMRFKLKNDCVCRFIAKEFNQASSVSILLYNAKSDYLENQGHFLSLRKSHATFTLESIGLKKILGNIFIYEYFAHKYKSNSWESCSYTDFLSFHSFNGQEYTQIDGTRFTLSLEIFSELKSDFEAGFKNYDELSDYKKYLFYKRTIANNDRYSLKEPDTASGQYYRNLIQNKKAGETISKPYELRKIENDRNFIFNVYKNKLDVTISENSVYLALPLFVKSRYIGLIRVLWHYPEGNTNWEMNMTVIEKWLNEYYTEDFANLASIVALHIGNIYSDHKFKQSSYNVVHNFLSSNIQAHPANETGRTNYLETFCEALRKTINCRFCIIRTSNNKNSPLQIRGWTKTLDKYVLEDLPIDHYMENSLFLDSLFNPNIPHQKNFRKINVIGVQFNIGENEIEDIVFLYLTEDEILNSTPEFDDLNFGAKEGLQRMFDAKIHKKIIDIDLHQVVILKMPYAPNGYVTFGNTIFRDFIKNDIEVIYPQICRIGAEFYVRETLRLEKQASFLTSLCHELRVPASLALDKAQKMNTEIDKLVESGFSLESLNSIVENLKSSNGALPKQFEYLIKFIDSRLGVYSLTNEILTSKLEAESVVKYNMAEKINYYMRMFVDIAYDKKNKIGIIKDWKDEDCGELITHDDDIFLGLFMYLMHNAIKYSFFDLDKRKKFVPNYNHNFKAGSDGHIKVACFSDDSVYGYSITNWGKQIPKQFARDIFTEHFRCPIDPDFETQTSPVAGEGLGMYYAKIYADLIKAEIIPEVDGKKTKMTVLWKKDKKN